MIFSPTTKILNHKNQLPGHHNSQSQFGYPWQSAYSQPTVLKAQIYFVYLCSSWRRYWPFNVLWYWGVNIVTEASRRAPGQGGAVLMMVMTPWTELQPDSKHCTQPISLRKGTRVSQMETLNMFYLLIYWTQKVHNDFTFLCSLLIRDSYPDVPLFQSLLRGDFISQWLQLLQHPLVSLLVVSDRVGGSLLQNWCRSWTA